MVKTKVLITGSTGLLGRSTFKAFKSNDTFEVFGTSFSRSSPGLIQIDLTNSKATTELIEDLKPDIVIHCAAERRPDVCENDPNSVQSLNVSLPALLSKLSLSPLHPFLLIYISTDYIFPGSPPSERGYEIKSLTQPTNLYGVSKLEGENLVLEGIKNGGKGCSLRVPVLYGPTLQNSESAINYLLDVVVSAQSQSRTGGVEKEIKMDNWAIRYPTNVEDVARVLVDLSLKSLETSLPPILNFSSQTPYTKYAISLLLASLLTPPFDLGTYEKFVKVDDGPKVDQGEVLRPRDCHLSNSKIEEIGISTKSIDFRTWWIEWLKINQV